MVKEGGFYSQNVSVDAHIERIMNDKSISKKNRDSLVYFLRTCQSENLSEGRIKKYASNFKTILKIAGKDFPLKDASEEQIKELMRLIYATKYSEYTKKDFGVALKKFYKTINDGYLPKKAAKIKTEVPKNKKVLPEDLITRDELNELILACGNERDRAFVIMLYEGGFRIGEIEKLKIKHLKFTNDGVSVNIPQGKTGPRRVLIVESEIYIRSWLKVHPYGNDPESFLWVKMVQTDHMEPVSYNTLRKIIRNKAKARGISVNKVNPHNFRHSRATELASVFTEAQLCQYFGWVQGSDMAKIYVHMSGRDVDKTILKMHGLNTVEEKKEPKRCPRCNKINPAESSYCGQCQAPLDLKTALYGEHKKMDNAVAMAVAQDEEAQLAILNALKKAGLLKNIVK